VEKRHPYPQQVFFIEKREKTLVETFSSRKANPSKAVTRNSIREVISL
jgi:hypothetical protein